jgi:hypothetical protein
VLSASYVGVEILGSQRFELIGSEAPMISDDALY